MEVMQIDRNGTARYARQPADRGMDLVWKKREARGRRRADAARTSRRAACGDRSVRLQMAPAYLISLSLGIVLIVRLARYPKASPRSSRIAVGLLSALMVVVTAVSVGLTYWFPIFTMPAPTGPYAIGTAAHHLTDRSREENVYRHSGR